MSSLVLDPGMVLVPEQPSHEESCDFVSRIIGWQKFVNENKKFSVFMRTEECDDLVISIIESQPLLELLAMKSGHLISAGRFLSILLDFCGATKDPLEDRKIAIALRNFDEFAPEQMRVRLANNRFELDRFLELVIFNQEIIEDSICGLISDIDAENVNGTASIEEVEGHDIDEQVKRNLKSEPVEYTAQIFKESGRYTELLEQNTSPTQSDRLNGKTIGIHALPKVYGMRAKRFLEDRYSGIRIRVRDDQVHENQLEQLVDGADIFVFLTTRSTHAATHCVELVRKGKIRKGMPRGSFIRASDNLDMNKQIEKYLGNE